MATNRRSHRLKDFYQIPEVERRVGITWDDLRDYAIQGVLRIGVLLQDQAVTNLKTRDFDIITGVYYLNRTAAVPNRTEGLTYVDSPLLVSAEEWDECGYRGNWGMDVIDDGIDVYSPEGKFGIDYGRLRVTAKELASFEKRVNGEAQPERESTRRQTNISRILVALLEECVNQPSRHQEAELIEGMVKACGFPEPRERTIAELLHKLERLREEARSHKANMKE